MQLRREEIESIVSEVLKKLGPTAVQTVAAAQQGDWGVFDRL
jgi:hypothetical protein